MDVILSIGGVKPSVQPLLDGYQVTKSDLLSDGSGRSAETGRAIRYLVRSNTYKLTLKFKGTLSEIAQVDSLVSQFEYEVNFLDGNIYVSANFYPSDRNVTCGEFTAELSVNLIEV